MRHLRRYFFNDSAAEISQEPLCTAIMPAVRMPFGRKRAKDYCGLEHRLRRLLAARLVFREARRPRPYFWAVFIMVCPERRHAANRSKRGRTPGLQPRLTPGNAYMGSYAAISPLGKIVVGDVMQPSLGRAYREATAHITQIMTRKPGERERRLLTKG